MDSLTKRLNVLIHLSSASNSEFAVSINESKSQISKYLNDKGKPGYETLVSILKKFPDLNGRWLLLGEKPVFLRDLVRSKESDEIAKEGQRKLVEMIESLMKHHANTEKEFEELMVRHLETEKELSKLQKEFILYKMMFLETA